MASLFSDLLEALNVKHTEEYSDKRFAEMPFQSMFGLSKLLEEYGIASQGVSIDADSRPQALEQLPVPFLADTPEGFALVTKVNGGEVTYRSQHKFYTAPAEELLDGWNGIALIVEADSDSIEPEFGRHHIASLSKGVKSWTLQVLTVLLLCLGMCPAGLCSYWQAWLILGLDCAGLVFSWMLVQKSLGVHTEAAEAVCSVMEEGGCDQIARSEASSFFGIFKWSEVGLAYFSVSILAMLLVPGLMPVLAAINVLCLPYTVWSITYQKFKAKAWCTLCVCVQCTLWLLFACYLLGGWTAQIFPITEHFMVRLIMLGCVYLTALLAINRLDNGILRYFKPRTDEND